MFIAIPCIFAAAAKANDVWTGGSPQYNDWTDSRNWLSGTTPTNSSSSPANIDFGDISGRTTSNQNIASFFGVNTFNFNGHTSQYNVTGQPIDLYYKIENGGDSTGAAAQTVTVSSIALQGVAPELDPTKGNLTVSTNDIYTNGHSLNIYGTRTLTINNTGGGGITQGGSFVQQNGFSGTVNLTGSNTYTGGTQVNGGTLLVNGGVSGTSSGTGTAGVAVNNLGTLGGTGAISGGVTVNNGGTINSGNTGTAGTSAAVGTLHTGALTLTSGSTSIFDVSGSNTYDQIVSSGAVTLGGTLALNFASGLSFTPGQVLDLVNGSSLTGTYQGIANGMSYSFSGYQFSAIYTTTDFELVAVPEPGTIFGGLLLLGALGVSQRKSLRSVLVRAACR